MLPNQKSVARVFIGLAASAAFSSVSWSATVEVSRQTQTVQTPVTAGQSGFSYVQTGSETSTLKVYTQGFLFCTNLGETYSSPATLSIAHEDQTMSPAHHWSFATTTDAQTVAYAGGSLRINGGAPTSLTCLGTAADGAIATDISSGIFDNSYDSRTDTNYNHMVNWLAPQGFDWSDPDWAQVPVDPCNPDGDNVSRVVEDVACSAVSGVRPAVTGGGAARAATIWSATDGTTFTYLLRFDARLGPQQLGAPAGMRIPDPDQIDQADDVTSVPITILDAFDSAFLGTGANDGQYCFLTSFPQALNSSVCSGAQTYPLNGKPMNHSVLLAIPPSGSDSYSFYVAVMRPVVGGHQTLTTPVVAAAALVERTVLDEAGNKFSGDDIVFGFMPTSQGFPWMNGQ